MMNTIDNEYINSCTALYIERGFAVYIFIKYNLHALSRSFI